VSLLHRHSVSGARHYPRLLLSDSFGLKLFRPCTPWKKRRQTHGDDHSAERPDKCRVIGILAALQRFIAGKGDRATDVP
jgi:hypothetical protein